MRQPLFDMWGPYRASLLKSHNFYIEQAKKRLLSQFENMEAEADQYSEDWLEQQAEDFDPDHDDPSRYYEQAHDASIDFYLMLENLRKNTRLSLVAGMFHEWDKQLRDWTTNEVRHWSNGDEVKKAIWRAPFECLIDLFEGLGWRIRSKGYFGSLNRCRLVVNAYKHGDGVALDEIRKSHPEFLKTSLDDDLKFLQYASHENLKIEDAHIDEFSSAIIEFWNDVPDRIPYDEKLELPYWFMKNHARDVKQKTGS